MDEKARESLRHREYAEERFRAVAEAVNDAIIAADGHGIIIFWNKAAERIFGYAAGDVTGKPLTCLMPERFREAHQAGLKRMVSTGESHVIGKVVELAGLRKDGSEFPLELSLSASETRDGLFFTGLIRDITERKHMERQARQLARTAELGQLLDGIAHELRNPLFVVTGNLHIMKEKLACRQYDTLGSDLQKIEEAARRMTAIADKFLYIAKPVKSQARPCSVHLALQEVLDFLSNDLMKRDITVVKRFAPALPDTMADPQQLRDIFLNLILNAAQAMKSAHGRGTLTVTAARADGWIETRIQDDGPGIPPEHMAKIFEPFFSTKPPEEATGLGLWTVRSTVAGLHGTVHCESEPGHGATFIVRLPIPPPP
jgi:two-component system NtrC family sensor kinase